MQAPDKGGGIRQTFHNLKGHFTDPGSGIPPTDVRSIAEKVKTLPDEDLHHQLYRVAAARQQAILAGDQSVALRAGHVHKKLSDELATRDAAKIKEHRGKLKSMGDKALDNHIAKVEKAHQAMLKTGDIHNSHEAHLLVQAAKQEKSKRAKATPEAAAFSYQARKDDPAYWAESVVFDGVLVSRSVADAKLRAAGVPEDYIARFHDTVSC